MSTKTLDLDPVELAKVLTHYFENISWLEDYSDRDKKMMALGATLFTSNLIEFFKEKIKTMYLPTGGIVGFTNLELLKGIIPNCSENKTPDPKVK